jgi:hypothetical protein
MSFVAVLVVCSAVVTDVKDCNEKTATQLAQLPGSFASIAECTREAPHAKIAALPPMLITEDYIRIVCVA